MGIVSHDGADAQPRKMSVQSGKCALQCRRRDVYRVELGAQLPPQQRLNQQVGLAGAAGAQFHQSQIVSRLAHHFAGKFFQDRALGACGIVLGRFRDPIKQPRAFGIVKKLGWKTPGARAQEDCRFVNCRHQPALCRKIASASPAGKSCDRWRECGSAALRRSLRAAPSARS